MPALHSKASAWVWYSTAGLIAPPQKKQAGPSWTNALDYEKQPLNFTTVVIWNQIKKGTATRDESNPSDSVGSSSPQKPVNQWWFQKEKTGDRQCRKKKVVGSSLRFLDLEKLVLYLGDCFSMSHFFDAFGMLRCSWCMEYLPALHWNGWLRLCGEMARPW